MKMFKQGLRALWCGAAAALMLSACGGGGGQVEPFKPTRIIALGDESSLITPAGKKYSVNALVTQTDATLPDKLDCKSNPIWVQTVATNFGLVFPQCNPDNVVTTNGVMYAQVGAKVADVKAQIDAHLASGSFNPKDLVTVLVGMHDVLELYNQYPAQSQATLLAQAEQRGQALADQVNRIVNANGRAIFVLTPDMGLTPFALAEKAAKPASGSDQDRAAFLTSLSARFNSKLRLGVINDGRLIGLVNGAEMTQLIVAFPGSYGFVNVDKVACNVALPDCTTKTMSSSTDAAGAVTAADGTTWLWADSIHFGAGMHTRLGSTAYSAASIHPF
nr:SGNH/GDSL hydrolase family protein [uncultured Roseateles sp.]